MEPRIMVFANEIINMTRVTLDPNSDSNQRHHAYQVYEDFKRSSPLCSEVGFYMFDKEQNFELPIRICGLNLLEWFVQNKWDKVDGKWRNEMKVKAIKLIELADFKEENSLKEAVVKVIVEVIKRSWPQEWSSLFTDLSNLQSMGNAQLQLVLIVLMRLSEDLNGLDDKVKQQRRKDMVSTLNQHLGQLFQFFITTIHDKAMQLKEFSLQENLSLTTAALNTITEYATWVNFEFLIAEEKVLFKVFFWLLEIDLIKYNAANCLNTIFERKGQPEKRVEMLVILSDDALNIVEKAAQYANMQVERNCDQEEYKFLKKLANMMVNFGFNEIAVLWGADKGFKERPNCFERYLKIILDFSRHQSMVITSLAARLWFCFGNHPVISKDEVFLATMHLLPNEMLRMLSKCSHPSLTENPGSKYSSMDFDNLQEFHEAFGDLRHAATGVIKNITQFIPQKMHHFCLLKAKEYLDMVPPDVEGVTTQKLILTNHYMLWDAFSQFCKNFFLAFFENTNNVTPEAIQQCNAFLQLLIAYNCNVPIFMTPIIITMETLFPIFKYSQDNLIPSMQKLASVMQLPPEGSDQKSHYRLKRHGIFILTDLCRQNPELIADKYEDLQALYAEKSAQNIFTCLEKKLFLEALLCICKTFKDPEKLKKSIYEILSLPISLFNKDDLKEALTNTSSFISYLGLEENEESESDAAILRRSEIRMALYTLEAAARALTIMKENEVDDDPDDQRIAETMSQYPWIQHMFDMLPHLFDIARQVCLLWTMVGQQSASFKGVLLQDSSETVVIKKKSREEQEDGDILRDNTSRKQFLVFSIHEALYTSLSLYGRCLGPALFRFGMMEVFIEKVVRNWVHLPNYRMRKVWRSIVKSFSLQCPAKYYNTILVPFLAIALRQMYERLTREWPRVQEMTQAQKKFAGDDDDENDESAEILELRVMYNLSKEVLDIIVCIMKFKRESYKKEHVKDNVQPTEGSAEMIGQLGEYLLADERTNMILINLLFSTLTWPDSNVITKTCSLITAIVRKTFLPSMPVNAEIPNQMMLRLLQGLQIHGSDVAGQTAIVNATAAIYLHLREQYDGLVHVLMMVPTCKEEDLKKFDESAFVEPETLTEATKRKRFRKLIEGAIGITVSELYKSNLQIQDLPPLTPRVKPKVDVIEDSDDAGLCKLFAPDEEIGIE